MSMHNSKCAWCGKGVIEEKVISPSLSTGKCGAVWHLECFNKVNDSTKPLVGTEKEWFRLANVNESLPVERSEDFRNWVAQPVVSHNLAPRAARAVLEIVGAMTDRGRNPADIIGLLLHTERISRQAIKASEVGDSIKKAFEHIRKCSLDFKTAAENLDKFKGQAYE